MIIFALFLAAEGMFDFTMPDFTKLFFKPHTLARGDPTSTQEQLVCVDTFPEDGCEKVDIEVVSCKRSLDKDWSSWKCTAKYSEKADQDHRLEFQMKEITCQSNLSDSCWLEYTVQPKPQFAEKFARDNHAQMCMDMCGLGYTDTRVVMVVLVPFLLFLVAGMLTCEVNEEGDGIKFKRRLNKDEEKTAIE